MKKKLLLIFFISVVCVLPTVLSAQSSSITYKGIQVGTGWSKWVGDDARYIIVDVMNVPAINKQRVHGGAFIGISLADNIILQTELNYSTKGAIFRINNDINNNVPNTSNYTDIVFRNNYIEIPFSLLYNFKISKKLHFGIYGGSALNFLVKSNVGIESNGFEENQEVDLDNINSFNYSIIFGSKFIFNLNSTNIHIDVRYSLGQQKMFSSSDATLDNWFFTFDKNSDVKNRQLSVTLGVEI